MAAGLKYVAAGHKFVAAGLKYVANGPTWKVLKQGLFEGFNNRSAKFQHLQWFLTKNTEYLRFLLQSS